MPAPRKPTALAKLTGSTIKNPARFANRADPKVPPLGAPSPWMTAEQASVWELFRREFPWLAESDRALVEIATTIRVRVVAGGEVGVQALNLLRQAISQMGGTPADRTKIVQPEDPGENDPASAYFN